MWPKHPAPISFPEQDAPATFLTLPTWPTKTLAAFAETAEEATVPVAVWPAAARPDRFPDPHGKLPQEHESLQALIEQYGANQLACDTYRLFIYAILLGTSLLLVYRALAVDH